MSDSREWSIFPEDDTDFSQPLPVTSFPSPLPSPAFITSDPGTILFSQSSLSLSPDDPARPGYLSGCPWLAQKPVTLTPLPPANSSPCLALFGSVTSPVSVSPLSKRQSGGTASPATRLVPTNGRHMAQIGMGTWGTAQIYPRIHAMHMRLASGSCHIPSETLKRMSQTTAPTATSAFQGSPFLSKEYSEVKLSEATFFTGFLFPLTLCPSFSLQR